jgi:hypothetical protein
MLGFGFPVLVRALLRAGRGVCGIHMQRSVGVAADESQRQDQDEAPGEQRSHKHEKSRCLELWHRSRSLARGRLGGSAPDQAGRPAGARLASLFAFADLLEDDGKFGQTGSLARRNGESTSGERFVFGIRSWF